ncbi:hypothetical protein PL321_09065 [Caloramator sp. mosi_1]|uniref:hypothetical protein n=1 Tax=Caloramator sp. mosi_1 TaxID=3023090 RepID=UPI0023630C34|nr:hypothetical protein [Caloramator sp. mosi_1]WDC85452.1 hypothetical protein PL321_09065 [Caloramator sp. mosi_1]
MKIDEKQAMAFIDNYLRYVLKGDYSALTGYYTDKLKASITEISTQSNPRPVAFKIGEGDIEKDKAEFKVTMFHSYEEKPYYSVDFFKYVVIMDKDKMLIDSIDKENSIDIYEQDKTLFKRDKDSGRGDKIFTLKDLPPFVYSKETVREQKYEVPRKSFGPCATTEDGKNILVSSIGENSYLGFIKLTETKETFKVAQGEEEKKKDESGKAQGTEEEGKEDEQKPKINFTIKDIDFYFSSTITSVIFSPNGQNLVVEVKAKDGLSFLALYKASGEKMDLKLERRFPKDRFSLVKPYFISENEVVFSVIPARNATDEETKLKGIGFLIYKRVM